MTIENKDSNQILEEAIKCLKDIKDGDGFLLVIKQNDPNGGHRLSLNRTIYDLSPREIFHVLEIFREDILEEFKKQMETGKIPS